MKKIFFLTIIILLILIFSGVLVFRMIYLPKDPFSTEMIKFSIEKGQGSREIALNLERTNLISQAPLFWFYVLIRGEARKLRAGDYLLSPAMNIPEIVKKIVSGQVIKEKITIVEGWNLKEIASYLSEKGICNEEKFFEIVNKDFSQEFDFLKDKPKNLSLEGYLFPDTYEISKSESVEDIVKKMLHNFDKKLTPELKSEIKKRGKTIFEIITMASLIEKEIYNTPECPDCKNLVSGILWKRLEVGMPLQVDATISYITGKKTIEVTINETKIDSPYNTYKYLGLPQGPICNPGLESILAALYPKESQYWYYLSTPEGKTIFSKTLEDHNIAKAKYLK